MDLIESQAWLRGERSSWNAHVTSTSDRNTAMTRCAEEDAARTQQAYWIVRTHKEGLVQEKIIEEMER